MADIHRFALLVLCVLFTCTFDRVLSSNYEVTIQTLTTGTNGIIRIQFFGILGESNFANAGDAAYFFLSSYSKKVIIETDARVGSLLKISLTVVGGHTAHIGIVTVVELLTNRIVGYDFQAYISEGMQEQRNSPSPDLFSPKLLVAPKNISQHSLTKTEGSQLQLFGDVKLNSTSAGVPTYTWFKKSLVNSPVPEKIGSNRKLLFTSIESYDGAIYFCVMSLGESVVKTEELNLIVNYLWMQPLQVIITGGSFIQEGASVQFICSGSSNLPDVVATWSNEGTIFNQGAVSLSYRFEHIYRNHSGIYTCKVEAAGIKREENFYVNVIYLDEPRINAPLIINNTSFILPNYTAELSCIARGNPQVDNYTILEDGKRIKTYGEQNNKFTVKKGGGKYTCIAQNSYLQRKTDIIINATVFKAFTSTNKDGMKENGIWTTEMITIVAIAIALFISLIVIITFVVCWCLISSKKKKTPEPERYVEKGPVVDVEENPRNIFYNPAEFQNSTTTFQNNYMDDSLKRNQEEDQLASSKSQLSASSEEYLSSNNDINSISAVQETNVITNGKEKVGKPDIEMSSVRHSKTHHDKKPRKHHKHHAEEAEVSNWSQANDSKAILNFHNNVEYC